VQRILFQIADKCNELSVDLVPLSMLKDVNSTESMMRDLLEKIQE